MWYDGKRKAHIQPSSVNSRQKVLQYPFLVFVEKVRGILVDFKFSWIPVIAILHVYRWWVSLSVDNVVSFCPCLIRVPISSLSKDRKKPSGSDVRWITFCKNSISIGGGWLLWSMEPLNRVCCISRIGL